ncbi:hypothetical protein KIW84_034749 [Lathyrus oleraceus]|uniref:Uncharacterized protein n=1 Tax=Pisum sativum TaxID=3888 RepID=A0A9D5AZT1_PEA|nr:hypothetical protein KIW84_034749 [Pisum sativum]
MPPRAVRQRVIDYLGIVFGEAIEGEAQITKYVKLFSREVTRTRLTYELSSSFSYRTSVGCQHTTATVRFRMFNRNYEFSQDHHVNLLPFPHRDGLACEGPIKGVWEVDALRFW